MTPRKLQALLNVHYDIEKQKVGQQSTRNKNNNQNVNGYIDTIPGW